MRIAVKCHAIRPGRVGFRYGDILHHAGAVIWWVGNHGTLHTFTSKGTETHHELNRRMDFDAHWRGRLDPDSGIATVLPPLKNYLCLADRIQLPQGLGRKLQRLGARTFYVDTPEGLRVMQSGVKSKGAKTGHRNCQ